MWRWGPPAFVALAAMVALTALTADAAARQARSAPTETTAPREAGEPIMAIVSIETQQVTFYDSEGWILRAPVSTGTTGRETPAGVFAVIEKDKDHHSTLYDDAWMSNMQRITWNGIALHGGPLPGYAASHGCVRMPYEFAEDLFDKTWIGMRVIISPKQWNRSHEPRNARNALSEFKFNQGSRAELSKSDVEASSVSLERLPHGDVC
jgi:lipoprotein-anchoring transpeptidase ErfK/SrfK